MSEARLHDGSAIEIEIHGDGPALLLPVNPQPVEGPRAEELRQYGADPALGYSLIAGLSDAFRVVAFDYEGQVMRVPKPTSLTPDNIVSDLLAVADAAGVERFAYYGYSWLAMVGLQLAIRTERLSALAMGGYPPLDGPYEEMLRVTAASYDLSASQEAAEAAPTSNEGESEEEEEWSATGLAKDQAQQFLTLYEALRGFDDRAAQARVRCPRLCFVGSADAIQYGKRWGDVFVSLAAPIVQGRTQLEALGWDVRVLEGLDHMQAMQAAQVLPILRPWLTSRLFS